MDQAQFAEALGRNLDRTIPRTQISDWERGRHEPGATVLIAAAELAGTSVDELLAGGGGPVTARLDALDDALQDLRDDLLGRLRSLEERLGVRNEKDDLETLKHDVGVLQAQVLELRARAGKLPSKAETRRREPRRETG